jgi:hypothetical protein
MQSKHADLEDNSLPVYIHKGYYLLKIIMSILLLLLVVFLLFVIKQIGLILFIIIIPSVLAILLIRYPELLIYKDSFEINNTSLLEFFSNRNTFLYKDIKAISYKEGKTDWTKFFILAIMGKGSYGGSDKVSNPDLMIIETITNEKHYQTRFGNEKGFVKAIELIKKQINNKA